MKFKNNILILTSINTDSSAVTSIVNCFKRLHQDYNIIVLDETHYGNDKSAKNQNKNPKLYNIYRKFKTGNFKSSRKTDFGFIGERKARSSKMSGVTKRIYNAIIRYCPDVILATTPETMHEAVIAKRKTQFTYPIVGLMDRFTVDRNFYSYHADAYIVENTDMKNQITSFGFPSDKVYVLGLPIFEAIPTVNYVIKKKEQLGLNINPTVYLSGGKQGTREMLPVFELLLDQGRMINIIVYCGRNQKLHSEILRKIDERKAENVKVYIDTDAELKENILVAADCVMTVCDIELIYRAFLLNIPVIAFAPKSALDEADLKYLESKKLIYYAHNYNFTIIGLYKLIQTNLSKRLVEAAAVRTRPNALEEICETIAYFSKRSEND